MVNNVGKLLEQFMGSMGHTVHTQGSKPETKGGGFSGGDFAGGAISGGVLGLLIGNKKARKMAGGLLGYGGAAAVGALAFKAYQNWQEGQAVTNAPVAKQEDLTQIDPRFDTSVNNNSQSEFALKLITAMISAAKADGHIDAREQSLIFERVEASALDAESKALVFDALRQPSNLEAITTGLNGIEQASEIYLASRLIADGDNSAEKLYMEVLAHRLQLPQDLVAHLDHQVTTY